VTLRARKPLKNQGKPHHTRWKCHGIRLRGNRRLTITSEFAQAATIFSCGVSY
jgi:hypothetical protein